MNWVGVSFMKKIGDIYEKLAQEYLINQGLDIITTNYHARHIGEIDMIAYEKTQTPIGKIKQTLVFVEVKMRHSGQGKFGQAIDAVTPAKQRKLIGTAEHFLVYGERFLANLEMAEVECRFDVVAFEVGCDDPDKNLQKQIKIHWLKNAFLVE